MRLRAIKYSLYREKIKIYSRLNIVVKDKFIKNISVQILVCTTKYLVLTRYKFQLSYNNFSRQNINNYLIYLIF